PFISLVYLVYPHPESLLVLQTAAIAAGVVPIYFLARDVLRCDWCGMVFAAVYLLFPSLEGMNLYEFHPVALATPLLLAAFLFAWRRRYVWFAVCSLAAIGTKEQIGLVIFMFGLYVALINRNRLIGFGMAVVGAFWSLFAALVIEKHYRAPGTLSYLHTRYGYLGHGVHGILHTVLHNPGIIAGNVFSWAKLGYMIALLAPTGFLAILGLPALLLAAPSFALVLFSGDFHMYTALGDNSAEMIAVVMIAAILGAGIVTKLLSSRLPRRAVLAGIAVWLLAGSLLYQHRSGYTPLGARFQVPSIGPHQRLENRFVSLIPPSVPVSTQDQLDPHLSNRRYTYLFEDTGREANVLAPANYIMLDVSAPTYPLPSDTLYDRARHWIGKPGWGVAAARDGLILIENGARSKRIQSAFYSFALADGVSIRHLLRGGSLGLHLLGYDVARTDLANHRVPNLAYSFYFRVAHAPSRNLQPVLYQEQGGKLINCSQSPLGLAWFPTTRWQPGHVYVVRMPPFENQSQTPGTARFYVNLVPVETQKTLSCTQQWNRSKTRWAVGTQAISFF
ncbi:MAG TPA: DUF2079 domain-containing protein, partial [Chloroflexota bacterium]